MNDMNVEIRDLHVYEGVCQWLIVKNLYMKDYMKI
jgi:hypothetical protein